MGQVLLHLMSSTGLKHFVGNWISGEWSWIKLNEWLTIFTTAYMERASLFVNWIIFWLSMLCNKTSELWLIWSILVIKLCSFFNKIYSQIVKWHFCKLSVGIAEFSIKIVQILALPPKTRDVKNFSSSNDVSKSILFDTQGLCVTRIEEVKFWFQSTILLTTILLTGYAQSVCGKCAKTIH